MTDRDVAVRAVVETLRHVASTDTDDALGLRVLADLVEAGAPRMDDMACCPLCAEVVCDDDCPLRHWRHADTPGA